MKFAAVLLAAASNCLALKLEVDSSLSALAPGKYRIKHYTKQEYLYVGQPKLDDMRYHVLGWTPGWADSDSDLVVTAHEDQEGSYYGFQSIKWGKWIYAGHPTLDANRRRVLTFHKGTPSDDPDMRWELKNHGAWWSIKSRRWNEYMYMGASMHAEKRRHVLTWGTA